jgi:multicomponent Na+:H+ antiporter subunit B
MNDLIVKTVARMLFPFIQVYGIYIILHGHLSFGGGFSGGALVGSSFILFTIIFGLKASEQLLPHHLSAKLESAGILVYLSVGLAGIVFADRFLSNADAGFPLGQFGRLISAGMIPILTLAIGVKVASTMITLFQRLLKEEHEDYD